MSISASVGRGGVNKSTDVTAVQGLLNKHVRPPIKVDGLAGPKTVAAIEDVQRRLVKMATPDGRVDPAGKTLAVLSGQAAKPAAPAAPPASARPLPAGGGGGGLTEADFARAAATLGCEVACIKAVTEVESGSGGFFRSGRPKILFEAHIFSKLTKHAYDASHPDISSRHWNRTLYAGGEKEYDRLGRAMALDHNAALQSASWGRFQVMGFHYQATSYSNVDAFVQAMYRSEGEQLNVFVKFIQHNRLGPALREKRWADFARGYNGGGYAVNHYDAKLKAAYEKHARGK